MKTLKQIWNKLFGKREEPSILEFIGRVEKIAKEHKETYYKAVIELNSSGCQWKGYIFKAYINGLGWKEGKTMEECLFDYENYFIEPK